MESTGIEGLREKPMLEMLLKGERRSSVMEGGTAHSLPRFGTSNR
jgi:hypothetical protein